MHINLKYLVVTLIYMKRKILCVASINDTPLIERYITFIDIASTHAKYLKTSADEMEYIGFPDTTWHRKI